MKGAIMLSGGGSGKLFAAIGVTYPAGSTLTCTNGTKTLKAKTTSGQWVFAIPEAGTWTVTATQGTNSKSQSVSITSEGQLESMALSYELVLFDNGTIAPAVGSFVGEAKPNGNYGSATYSVKTTLKVSADSGYNGASSAIICTENAVDVTDFDVIEFDVKTLSGSTEDRKLGLSGSKLSSSFSASVSPSAVGVATVDVSKLQGSYYPTICASGWHGGGPNDVRTSAELSVEKILLR